VSLFNAKILERWLVYIFDVYHQHGQDKITSTKHVLAGQLDYRDILQILAVFHYFRGIVYHYDEQF
jgi:hypothetical protein